MTRPQEPQTNDEQKQGNVKPEGEGESAGRRKRLEAEGGRPLTKPLEDGQLRGADEEGRHTTGTHGGPKKDGNPGHR